MRIIYFDICAIPLLLMILFVCFSRRMTRGMANRLFIAVVFISLFCTVSDLCMEITSSMVPLGPAMRVVCTVSANIYLAFRNANNAVLLLFLLALTRTTFLIRKRWVRILFALPYLLILFLLVQNLFTHTVFTVTSEAGYSRGPLMLALYGIALLYGLVGLAYCIFCRRYLPTGKWIALLSVYFMAHAAVLVQFFYPRLLLEMFCTALGEMLIMLSIMRPEERMDISVGMLSWASYQTDLRNILRSGEEVQILVIRISNSRELRIYLGDYEYDRSISEFADSLRAVRWQHPNRVELYFERPGTMYLILAGEEEGAEGLTERLLSERGSRPGQYAEQGVHLELHSCLIRCPEDLHSAEDIISLGHKFRRLDDRKGRTTLLASEIVHSRTFAIESHITEIIERALKEGHIEMYYQPVYDVRSGSFHSAEALVRIEDPEYGLISPAVFIPAAETEGYIIPIGDTVLEEVFRFISEHDLDAMGLSYIEINLSVAQCMESSLPEKIRTLQERYGVDPSRINLEITETTFENIGEVMLKNINELIRMGYSFALDDYGIGYSSIQRINHIPLRLIKIDKSMLEEVYSANGRVILEYTVRMMQSIGKQLVVEGAETGDEVNILADMKCDYIQGFYFSRPLPAERLVYYIMEHKKSA